MPPFPPFTLPSHNYKNKKFLSPLLLQVEELIWACWEDNSLIKFFFFNLILNDLYDYLLTDDMNLSFIHFDTENKAKQTSFQVSWADCCQARWLSQKSTTPGILARKQVSGKERKNQKQNKTKNLATTKWFITIVNDDDPTNDPPTKTVTTKKPHHKVLSHSFHKYMSDILLDIACTMLKKKISIPFPLQF